MINIALGKKYLIKSDRRQYKLYKRHSRNGKEHVELLGTYKYFDQVVSELFNHSLRTSDATTLKELKEVAIETNKLVAEIRKELSYEPDKS